MPAGVLKVERKVSCCVRCTGGRTCCGWSEKRNSTFCQVDARSTFRHCQKAIIYRKPHVFHCFGVVEEALWAGVWCVWSPTMVTVELPSSVRPLADARRPVALRHPGPGEHEAAGAHGRRCDLFCYDRARNLQKKPVVHVRLLHGRVLQIQ